MNKYLLYLKHWGIGAFNAVIHGVETAVGGWLGSNILSATGVSVPSMNSFKALGSLALGGAIYSFAAYIKANPLPDVPDNGTPQKSPGT